MVQLPGLNDYLKLLWNLLFTLVHKNKAQSNHNGSWCIYGRNLLTFTLKNNFKTSCFLVHQYFFFNLTEFFVITFYYIPFKVKFYLIDVIIMLILPCLNFISQLHYKLTKIQNNASCHYLTL